MALPPVVERLVLHWGEMGTLWNVNRSVSQIHALLYFSEKPLPAEDIADALGIARSNVSTSIKELQSFRLIRMVHVLGDRRDHFEALQDISQLFRVIIEERKRRELDPTVALLRECLADQDPHTPLHVRQKLKSTLGFLETLNRWYEDMKGLPHPLFMSLLRMGARIQRYLKSDAA